MAYLFETPPPISVTVDELGQPLTFTYRNQRHKVDQAVDRYRVDTGWWDNDRKWREYFQLITTDGMLVEVYRDLDKGGWYLRKLYD